MSFREDGTRRRRLRARYLDGNLQPAEGDVRRVWDVLRREPAPAQCPFR
jgi:hypothetical protein